MGGPAAPPVLQEELGKATFEEQEANCQPGKEHWSSPGPPVRGGEWIRTGSAPHMDPSFGSAVGISAYPQIYNMLLAQRACFREDSALVPSLAKSWEVSSDSRTYTFHLQQNVKWHNKPPVNGRPFTSADVAWTIDYQQKGAILKAYWEGITHREPDPYTVVVQLPEPQADFLYYVGFHQNVILPHEVKEQYGDFKTVAIGTGAFMSKEFKANSLHVMERNPDYWEMGSDGKPAPYLDGLRSIELGDPTASSAAFLAGQLLEGNAAEKFEYAEWKKKFPKYSSYIGTNGQVQALWFNSTHKPWDDVRLRKAVALAISREDITEGSRKGSYAPAGFFPGGLVPWVWSAEKQKVKFPYKQEEAKRLLAEAGYTPGSIKNVYFQTTASYLQDAEVVQQNLKLIGIDAPISMETGLASGGGSSFFLIKGDYDLCWCVTSPSYFASYWGYDLIHSKSPFNIFRANDPQLDRLAEAQRRELDFTKRRQLMDQIQDRLYELMPIVPVQSSRVYRLVSCQVKNMHPPHYQYQLDGVQYAWIDPAGC